MTKLNPLMADILAAHGMPESTPAAHAVKIWPQYFDDVDSGVKPFEVRFDDRGYRVGDLLKLREFSPVIEKYTGRVTVKEITYILLGGDFGIMHGYVVMGLKAATP